MPFLTCVVRSHIPMIPCRSATTDVLNQLLVQDSSIESLMMVTSSEFRNTCTFALEKEEGGLQCLNSLSAASS